MITVRQVESVAAETGFRSDMVEKVLRLHDVLRRLTEHPMTARTWVLKGGTALNWLHLDVPRLSADMACLIDLVPDLVDRPEFRLAFLCFAGGGRQDVRQVRKPSPLLPLRTLRRDVEPLLRLDANGVGPKEIDLAAWIERTVPPALDRLLDWSSDEQRFLDRLLDDGEIDAEALHDDPAVQERVRRQSMLAWKALHVREHRRRT